MIPFPLKDAPDTINKLIAEYMPLFEIWALFHLCLLDKTYDASAIKEVFEKRTCNERQQLIKKLSDRPLEDHEVAPYLQTHILAYFKNYDLTTCNLTYPAMLDEMHHFVWHAPAELALKTLQQLIQAEGSRYYLRDFLRPICAWIALINARVEHIERREKFYRDTLIPIHFPQGLYKPPKLCARLPVLAFIVLYTQLPFNSLITYYPFISNSLKALDNMRVTIVNERDSEEYKMTPQPDLEYNEFSYCNLSRHDKARTQLLTRLKEKHDNNYAYSFNDKRLLESHLKEEAKSLNTLEKVEAFRSKYKDAYFLNYRRYPTFDKFCHFFSRKPEPSPTQTKKVFTETLKKKEDEITNEIKRADIFAAKIKRSP